MRVRVCDIVYNARVVYDLPRPTASPFFRIFIRVVKFYRVRLVVPEARAVHVCDNSAYTHAVPDGKSVIKRGWRRTGRHAKSPIERRFARPRKPQDAYDFRVTYRVTRDENFVPAPL